MELNKCFFVAFFPQESFIRDAGHSVLSSVLVVVMNCPLHTFNKFPTLDNKFATESVPEICKQAVHVLVVDLECIQVT